MTVRAHRPWPLRTLTAWSLAAVLLVSACQAGSGSPQPTGTPATAQPVVADLTMSEDLRVAVESEAIHAHLDQLYAFAQANNGIRAAGTRGHDLSVRYVADLLDDAGYEVTLDEFTFPFFTETAPSELTVVGGPTFAGGDHLRAMIFSASGDVTAPIVAVALNPDGSTVGSAGCAASDWVAFPKGAVALAGPGGCISRRKVDQAITAGAAALIVANPNWPVGEVRRPTLLDPAGVDIPAVAASAQVGQVLRTVAADGGSVHVSVQTLIEDRVTSNVIAERVGAGPGPVADDVVMLGAHLDSVIDGPGINDNGSGTMTILEIALQLAQREPVPRTVRFAFWTAEELGLYGSRHWVENQTTEELARIVAYLNFDMLASPNDVRQVYGSPDAVAGDRAITADFGAYFEAVGLAWETEDMGAVSDHAPFQDAGIPIGGLFSGATQRKSAAQAVLFGGTAREPADRCYHLACDTPDRINLGALAQMSDAAAHVLMVLLLGGLD